jgi:galactose oxidase-like protein
MRQGRERRGRGRRLNAALIACGALIAATLAAAPILLGGPARVPNLAIAEGGLQSHYPHGEPPSSRRAYSRLLANCARSAYRAAHYAFCPGTGPRPLSRGQKGAAAVDAAASQDGQWGPKLSVPSLAIHAVTLATGKVLWVSRNWSADGAQAGANAWLFDPATGTSRRVDPPSVRYPDGTLAPANIWCGGQVVLPDGRVLFAGGNLSNPTGDQSPAAGRGFKGARWVFTFDPWTETWTRQPDMAHGRWYPSLVTLDDGTVLILGGWDESGRQVNDQDIELFTPGAGGVVGVRNVGQLPAERSGLSLYPHLFLLPETTLAGWGGGKVLLAGRAKWDTAIIDTRAIATTGRVGWRQLPPLDQQREWGTAVLDPGGPDGSTSVTLVSGTESSDGSYTTDATASGMPPTPTSVRIDLNDPGFAATDWNPKWNPWVIAPRLVHGRAQFNTVLLPDGSQISLGGGFGLKDGSMYADPVTQSELLDPGAGAWRGIGVEADSRTYHSTAVLLPDGRVLSAGDDREEHRAASARSAQIYSPPYLFRGARPSVGSAPASAGYAAPFRVETPDAASITRAVLVRPGAVTHTTDMDQRLIQLQVAARDGGSLTLQGPGGPSLAPPGYYMLFLLNARGVPSVARFIRLGASPEPAPAAPAAAPAPVPAPAPAPTSAPNAAPVPAPAVDRRAPRAHLSRARAIRRGRTLVVRATLVSDERGRATATLSGVRRTKREQAARMIRLRAGRRVTLSLGALAPPRGRTGRARLTVLVRDASGNLTRVRASAVIPRR